MWKPIYLEFSNLFSHTHTELKFNKGMCTLIIGENKTDSGVSNNGSGKSVIFEAIALALLGRSLREVDKNDFINDDAEVCDIKFQLRNDALNKDLTIVRKYFRGNKSAKVTLFEDGKANNELVSVLEVNKRILELLQLTAEDLLRYYIIYQGNQYTFFTAGDAEKKTILNRITNADIILPKIAELKAKVKQLTEEEEDLTIKIEKLVSKEEVYSEQLEELRNSDTSATEISDLESKLREFKENVKERQDDVIQATERVKNYEKKIASLKIVDTTDLKNQLRKAKAEKEEADDELSSLKSTLRDMQNELDHVITCPNCSHEFIKDSEVDMSPEEIREGIEVVNKSISVLKKRIPEIKIRIESIKDEISDAEAKQDKRDMYERRLKQCKRDIEYAEKDVDNYKSRIKKIQAEIKEIKSRKKDNTAEQGLIEKIEKCKQEVKTLQDNLQAVQTDKEMAEYWSYYLGKSGFQTYLANRSINLLEGYVNSFLKKLKTDLSVDISGFKILADGTVREKIEIFALTNGMNPKLLKGKSGGEQERIKLAGIMALQYLINMSTQGGGLDLLLLDETLHAADTLGTENIIKTLENIGTTILMITQNVSDEYNTPYKIKVVKEDNISRIV